MGCFLLTTMAPGQRDIIEHGNGDGLSLGDDEQWGPAPAGMRKMGPGSPIPASPPLPAPSWPCLPLAGKATGTRLIHHQLRRMREQNKDKGRSPETCSFHRELLQGNKAADVRNATGLFARAALCLRQRGHASACRFKSYCCSGLGASLFPLPFRQAWSQPGIKLFKSSRWASQLNSCTELTGCEILRAPALAASPRPSTKGTGPRWFPLPRAKGPNIQASDTSSPALLCKGTIKP